MKNLFDIYDFEIGEPFESPFLRKNGIYQDGTTPMYRDSCGKLWAMSGHTHLGHIGMFCGNSLDDLTEVWEAKPNFKTGSAEYAFDGIKYPEGIMPRGSVWPFGLYICPNTHRFFCWFHNESGWNGEGTAYDAFGPCETPLYDSDFRHIGLMHSDDEGKTWDFDRWVLAGEKVAFTSRYNPGAGIAIGQQGDIVQCGSGDFSLFVNPNDDYIYLFYNIITMDLSKEDTGNAWQRLDTFVARTHKRTDGVMGDFVKYCEGSFCEAGVLGKESAILPDSWHPRVVYSEPLKMYIMTSKPILKAMHGEIKGLDSKGKVVQISYSKDLVNWSEPKIVYRNGVVFGNHYNALVSNEAVGQPHVLQTNSFSMLCNHNATDVLRYPIKLTNK